tara:strand:+ start:118 stop:378 length:261 start_codon:yes stop_codon:yes gene_type:complete
MSEIKKIKEEELKLIIEQQKNLNNLLVQTGVLDFQKSKIIEDISGMHTSIEEYKQILESEYGSININLEDGSYEEIEKEDVKDKKD